MDKHPKRRQDDPGNEDQDPSTASFTIEDVLPEDVKEELDIAHDEVDPPDAQGSGG